MHPRLPRWAALLAVPLLAGALLLMHGLDAGAGDHGVNAASASVPHSHEAPAGDQGDGCGDCLAGHLVAACVAVLAGFATVQLARRVVRGRWSPEGFVVARDAVRAVADMLRPPDPAWIRLAVMRC